MCVSNRLRDPKNPCHHGRSATSPALPEFSFYRTRPALGPWRTNALRMWLDALSGPLYRLSPSLPISWQSRAPSRSVERLLSGA